MNEPTSLRCPELSSLIGKRLRKANLPTVPAMATWTVQDVRQFDAIQEVIMTAVHDFAIRKARRELKALLTKGANK